MARRAGKAANRKARQRSAAQRAIRPSALTPPTPRSEPLEPIEAIPPVDTPDAREADLLDPPRRASAPSFKSGASTLTTRERAEYHYVERDLRNIGILTVVMAALLLLAWLAFSALNLTG